MTNAASSVFFKRTFDETVSLLVETRNYIEYADPADAGGLTTAAKLRIHAETMRITARLAQAMAWLLAQKAVAAGELSATEAVGDRFAVPDDPTCMAETDEEPGELPTALVDLLGRSRRLYVRVRNLDALVRRSVEDERVFVN
jgi:regulator of CtrA degradation